VEQPERNPKPVNARLYMLKYELRCRTRFFLLCLKTGIALAILLPIGIVLFPFLFWAPFLNVPLLNASQIREGWPDRKSRSLLGMDPEKRHFFTQSASERRKRKAYEKAKEGLPLTMDDVGSPWTDRLYSAIQKMDLDGVQIALRNGASPGAAIDGDGGTPLWFVVSTAQSQSNETKTAQAKAVAATLLDAGAKPSSQELLNILTRCAKNNDMLFLWGFELPGAIEALSRDEAQSVLLAAAEGLRPAIWRRLLEAAPSFANAAATAKDDRISSFGNHLFGDDSKRTELVEGDRALHFLAMASEEHLDDMARRQANSRANLAEEKSQALRAIQRDAAECLGLLLSHGADLEARGVDARTPLLQAIWHGSLHVATLLLEAGAKASARDAEGRSSLAMLTHITATAKRVWWSQHPEAAEAFSKRLAMAMDREAIEAAANEAIPVEGRRAELPDGVGPRRL
jgi:hypothetical protein